MKVRAKHDIVQYLPGKEFITIPKGTIGEVQPYLAAFIGIIPVIFEGFGYKYTSEYNVEPVEEEEDDN